MNFTFTEEQNLLRDSARKWVADVYPFEQRRRQLKAHGGFDPSNWARMAELGWLALPFAEADGGLAGSVLDVAILMEAFGHGLVLEPYLANVMLAGNLLRQAADEAQRQRWLPGLIDGSRQFALAYAEPDSRHALHSVRTRATRQGDGWRLDGQKALVINGDVADVLVVVARTDGDVRDTDGLSVFVVDARAPGVQRLACPTFDGFRAAEIRFDNVPLPDADRIGPAGAAHAVLQKVIDEATVAVCAEAIGIMESLYMGTVDYTKTRKQFGVPISSFQVLQHRMVDMFIQHEQARSLLLMAAIRLDEGDPLVARRAVSALKAYCGKAGRYIGQQSVQLHGGMGMTDEFSVGHAFKRLTAIDLMFGNEDFHLRRFAESA